MSSTFELPYRFNLNAVPAQLASEISNSAIAGIIEGRWSREHFDRIDYHYQDLIGTLPDQARVIAITPVAAAQESRETLMRLLDNHARQDLPPGEFGSLLSLNYVGKSPPANLDSLLDAIDEAHWRWPHLSVGAATIAYDELRPIAAIRNDAWSLALWHVFIKGIKHTVTGISNDVDLVHVQPGYARAYAEAVEADDTYCYGGPTRLDLIGNRDTPLNKLIRYRNFGFILCNCMAHGTLFEHNMALSLDRYANLGSWGTRELAEGVSLLQNFNFHRRQMPRTNSRAELLQSYRIIPACANKTSSRRMARLLVENFQSGGYVDLGKYDFRTDNADPARALREADLLKLANSEVTDEALVAHLRQYTDAVLMEMVLDEAGQARAQRLFRIARHIIGLPIDI